MWLANVSEGWDFCTERAGLKYISLRYGRQDFLWVKAIPVRRLLLAPNNEKNSRTNEQHAKNPVEINWLVKDETANEQGPDIS